MLEIGPALDAAMVLVGPGPLLPQDRSLIMRPELPFGKAEALLETDKIVSHTQPELDEIIEIFFLRFPVASVIDPISSQEFGHDRLHDRRIDEVFDEWRPCGLLAAHKDSYEFFGVRMSMDCRKVFQHNDIAVMTIGRTT